MDASDLSMLVRLDCSGLSVREIARQTGIPKSTVLFYLDRIRGTCAEDVAKMVVNPQAAKERLTVDRKASLGYTPPDYETVYIRNRKKGKERKSLKALWEAYCENIPQGSCALGYKAFCKGFAKFASDLPPALREVSMTNTWTPGEVVMIDYSGDGLFLTDIAGNKTKVQIFVAVLGYSGKIFCCATPRQTRDDWLDAQIKMFRFYQGVSRSVLLDNSTSLVIHADRINPKICKEYQGFLDYYGTVADPVRPYKPKDKALVENAVLQVQRTVIKSLSNRTFFDIDTLNKEILKELAKLNERQLTTRSSGISRESLFMEEKPALSPLPLVEYETSMELKILKVQKNYVIRYCDCRYSVPAVYIGKLVKVLICPRLGTLQVFDMQTGERIANHYLMKENSGNRILPEHMPENHKAMLVTKEQLLTRMEQCGKNAGSLAVEVLRHSPGQTGRKLLRSMDALRCRYGNEFFESVCAKTMNRTIASYDTLLSVIDLEIGGVSRKTIQIGHQTKLIVPAASTNVRGADYYRKIIKEEK